MERELPQLLRDVLGAIGLAVRDGNTMLLPNAMRDLEQAIAEAERQEAERG